ncbi:MAG: DUF5689 domain-containing protein, partial [Flavobacteriaceae bacterium]
MKTTVLIIALLFFSCSVQNDSLEPTNTIITYPKLTSSLEAIRERVRQSDTGFVKFGLDEDTLWVEGYVTSNDEGGNFYKELYLQDDPVAPHTALRLLIDRTSLSDFFPRGRRIIFRLNGWGAGMKSNILTLGDYQGNTLGNFPIYKMEDYFVFTDDHVTIQPKVIDLAKIDKKDIGQWVSLENVQLAKAEHGRTFSGEAFDQYDGERRLVQCINQRSLFLSTSRYADFKSVVLPNQSGKVEGIFTHDFYGEKEIIKINDPTNLSFDGLRCDPFFEESFETVPLGRYEGEGWSNFNIEGTQLWEVFEDENSMGQSIEIGAYRSGDTATVSWLISPQIDVS